MPSKGRLSDATLPPSGVTYPSELPKALIYVNRDYSFRTVRAY